MSTPELKGRTVVVTGGTGGLGATVVEAFRAAGAEVVVPRRDGEPRVDLTDEAQVTAFYASLPSLWASVHLAGGFAAAPFTEISLAELRAQHDLNLVTCFLACREAVKTMRARSGGGGRIVNVTARPALSPAAGMIAYTTAKAGVASLTQCLAAEVLQDGILVNAIVPSIIDTPQNRKSMPNADHTRWPTPAEIARAVLWLASPDNAVTSGTLVPVYGRA